MARSTKGVQTEFFAPAGGLDIVTPPFLVRNGVAISALNMEVDLEAGYSRIGGYDRYVNGLTASQLTVQVAVVNRDQMGTAAFTGVDLVGQTSGAIMKFATMVSPSPEFPDYLTTSGNDTPIYVSAVSGTPILGELLTVDDSTFVYGVYVLVALPVPLSGTTPEERAASRFVAETTMRDAWKKPGYNLGPSITGSILGLFVLNDTPVAIKGSYDTAACVFFEGNASVPFLTNRQWVVTNFNAPLPNGTGYNLSTISSIPWGFAKFEFVVDELGSSSAVGATTDRAFGVSGTSRAFIYYNGTLDFITTGMARDVPEHLAVHRSRLFLSFGSSLQYSQAGDPKSWTPVLGAGEINTGSPITGLLSLTGESEASALLVSTEDRLFILYGDSDSNFQLVPFAEDTGALPGTLRWMGMAMFQNAFGLTSMSASRSFGGFENSTFSGSVKPFVDARRGKAVTSMICRNKNQYRIFFNDGSGLYCTFKNGKPAGIFPVQFGHTVTCSWSCVSKGRGGIDVGEELMLIGTADGEVLRLDVGWSFNGGAIPWSLRLAFNHLRSPRLLKHFIRTAIEIQTAGYLKIQAGYDLDYRSTERSVTNDTTVYAPETGSNQYWQDAQWNQGRYDVTTVEPTTLDTPGSGVNFSLRMQGNDATTQPWTLTGVLINYVLRRLKR